MTFLGMITNKLGQVNNISIDILDVEFSLESLASRKLYNEIAFVHIFINISNLSEISKLVKL